jgi:cell division septal protein FtsQ
LIYKQSNLFVISNFEVIPFEKEKFEILNNETILLGEYLNSENLYFEIDLKRIENDIQSISPFIEKVFISKIFPNRLKIEIKERTPFVALEIEQKRCILLDNSGFVLEIEESNCNEIVAKYTTILVKSDDPKINFVKGTASIYYQLLKIEDILKVMNKYQIPVTSISIKENIAIFNSVKEKKYIFSFNQDIQIQLSRFIAVLSQLEKKSYTYKQIDFRFKRPVLTIK